MDTAECFFEWWPQIWANTLNEEINLKNPACFSFRGKTHSYLEMLFKLFWNQFSTHDWGLLCKIRLIPSREQTLISIETDDIRASFYKLRATCRFLWIKKNMFLPEVMSVEMIEMPHLKVIRGPFLFRATWCFSKFPCRFTYRKSFPTWKTDRLITIAGNTRVWKPCALWWKTLHLDPYRLHA